MPLKGDTIIYLLDRGLVEAIHAGRAVSLERDLFPNLVGDGLRGLATRSAFIDIGTPQSYLDAQSFLDQQ